MVYLQNTNLVWSLPLPKSHQQLSLFPGKGHLPDMASQGPSLSPLIVPDSTCTLLFPLYSSHTDALCSPLSQPQGFVPSLSSAWKALSCSLASFPPHHPSALSANPPSSEKLPLTSQPSVTGSESIRSLSFFTALIAITNLHLQLYSQRHS